MRKIVDFFGGSARRRTRETHPADAIVGTGRVGRGLGKGGGVLLARATASCLVEDTRCHDDGNGTIVWCNLRYFRGFDIKITAGTPKLAIRASQWHGEVLPPCHCGARIASMRY
jgi:hypothetical protein